MLTRLSIRNIVLIEALDLDFSSGLGVLTGETGAGKSILLDALGLVLGSRAESSLVRAGEERALVIASFERVLDGPVSDLLADAGVEVERDEPLILKRQIRSDGGSKAFVNDQPVSVSLLKELAPFLVEMHGQHDDRGYTNPRNHRALLDRYANTDIVLLEKAWQTWRKAEKDLTKAREDASRSEQDRELLTAFLEELVVLAPEEGEETELAACRADLQKGTRLSDDLSALCNSWQGSDSPTATLRLLARKLDMIAGEHASLAEALESIDRALIEMDEAEGHLAHAADCLINDPAMLDQVEVRLFDLRAAARKHDCQVDDLPAKMAEFRETLNTIEGHEARVQELSIKAERAAAAFREAAQQASKVRMLAARRLDKAVTAELPPLKLEAAQFQTKVTTLPETQWGPFGMDSVEFLISTNPGTSLGPLGKIASGGELSRFILALKVPLAERGGAATVIFDEIDSGVGGAVASAIGERLARLANEGGQLLVVTHSPQVAARGNAHYVIHKSSEGTVTRTSVNLLDDRGRRQEIARMLSGAEITDEARAQADRLLEGV